jgi:hypothetical protein
MAKKERKERKKMKVRVAKGHGKKPGKRVVTVKRQGPNKLALEVAVSAGDDNLNVKFDYDFQNTEYLDLIEQRINEGVEAILEDGEITSDEALDFLQAALHAMAVGIEVTRNEVDED